jgi:hypothetical protein
MNSATQSRVRGAALKVAGDLFDEHTVRSILTDLREEAGKGSALREIGDFVVHPSERDRGPNVETIVRSVRGFVAYFRESKAFDVKPAFSAEQLIEELVEHLEAAGVPVGVCEQVRARGSEIILCIFGLVQGASMKCDETTAEVRLIVNDKGRLELAFEFSIDDLKIPGLERKNVKALMPLISSNVLAPGSLRFRELGALEVVMGPDGRATLREAR